MHDILIRILVLVVAVIHLLPLTGVLGADKLAGLYGLDISDPSLEILMRHRAVLFGLLGVFLAYAAFQPSLLPIAFIAAFVSIGSFFWLAFSVGNYNPAIRNVVIADTVAAACLLAAVLLYWLKHGH